VTEKLPTPALDALPEHLRKFAQGCAAGMTNGEAARHAGSSGSNDNSLKVTGCRWAKRPDVQAAIAELRASRVDDEDGLWAATMLAIKELLADKSSPVARARACRFVADLQGRLAPKKHLHAHAHVHQADLPPVGTPEFVERAVRNVRALMRVIPRDARTRLLEQLAVDVEPPTLPRLTPAGVSTAEA